MKKLLAGLLTALALCTPAQAQKAKSAIQSEINTNIIPNTSGLITPQIMNQILNDIVASYLDTLSPSQCAAFQGTFADATGKLTCSFVNTTNMVPFSGAGILMNPNPTVGTAQIMSPAGLPLKVSPSPTNDFVLGYDATGGSLAKFTPASIAGSITTGVASIGGGTGVILLGAGMVLTGQTLRTMGDVTATTNLYIAPTGNDTNNRCQSNGSPCLTPQHAADSCPIGSICNLNVADGTYAFSGTGTSVLFFYYHRVLNVIGNCTNPQNVIWDIQSNGMKGFDVQDGALLTAQCITFTTSTAATNITIASYRQMAFGDVDNMRFTAPFNGGTICSAVNNASLSCAGTFTWTTTTGMAQFGASSIDSFLSISAAITLPIAGVITNFYGGANNSYIDASGATYSGAGSGTGNSGSQCSLSSNALINLSAVNPPGATNSCQLFGGAGKIQSGVTTIDWGPANTAVLKLPGNPNATAASAGYMGELISCAVASSGHLPLATNTSTNVCSITVTPGDWSISGSVYFDGQSTTQVSYTAGEWSTDPPPAFDFGLGRYSMHSYANATIYNFGFSSSENVPPNRFLANANTTIYLNGISNFTVSGQNVYGRLEARRMR
jgi:hypothetical protein